ncbi:LOW QUALITY PROTEIN: hypothetical protein MAR_026864, partial [Mya arenaria]
MKAFLAIVLNMCLIRKSSIASYLGTHRRLHYLQLLCQEKIYQNILGFFHMEDNDRIPTRDNPYYSILHELISETLRRNRSMLKIVKNATPAPGTTVYARQGPVFVAAFRDHERRKPVRLLTTAVTASEVNGKPAV